MADHLGLRATGMIDEVLGDRARVFSGELWLAMPPQLPPDRLQEVPRRERLDGAQCAIRTADRDAHLRGTEPHPGMQQEERGDPAHERVPFGGEHEPHGGLDE